MADSQEKHSRPRLPLTKKDRQDLAEKRQEAKWARRSGEVKTRTLSAQELTQRKTAKKTIVDSPFRKTTTRA